jgi:sugar phosphate isomerase/epimerase
MSGQALQLYTLREFTKTADAVRTTLERVREIGFRAVQVSAVAALEADLSPDVLGQWLRELGLQCIATHRPWASLIDKTEREIAFHKALGCDYVAIGGIPDGYDKLKPAEYRRFIDESRAVRTQLAVAGIRFGHHNHAFEFDRGDCGADVSPWDVLIADGGLDYFLELDVYWAWHAGVDPVGLFRRMAGRVPVVHIKDKAVIAGEPKMAPIGEGNLPWESIIAAGNAAGVAWWCVEQDECHRDAFASVTASYRYLKEVHGLQ